MLVVLPLTLSGSGALACWSLHLRRGWELTGIFVVTIFGVMAPAMLSYRLDRLWEGHALESDIAFAFLCMFDVLGAIFVGALFGNRS